MKHKTFWNTFLTIALLLLFGFNSNSLAQEETESGKRMAEMMAKMIDQIWDQTPENGKANIRILMLKDGEPFAGDVSIHTDFSFMASGRFHHTQGFNPNSNGRWVYEGLAPGTYTIELTGFNEFEGWTWKKEGVKVEAGDAPLLKISLD